MFDEFTAIPTELRWRNQKHPAPIVVSIIRSQPSTDDPQADNSYLLIKRKEEPYRGYWALVGGKWDFGEKLAEAAVREVKEETGLDCAFVSLQGLANERALVISDDELGGAHFLLFVCLVDGCDGTAEEQEEGAVAWFSEMEIAQLKARDRIIPSDYAMLMQFKDANSLPFVEAEMEPAGADGNEGGRSKLVKFRAQE
jgi:8-oxo-dGTP diphosphatase